MRKVAYVAAALIVVVIGLLLVIPSFVDLNDYKAEIADRAAALTGRQLDLAGDIDLSLLPAPTLSVSGISLSNVEGARQPQMATLKALEVRVALLPLLSQQVQVERITLVEPVMWLEVLPSGRQNWIFEASGAPEVSDATGGTESSEAGPSFHFDRIDIENGRINYFDSAGNVDESITDVNARVSAASLEGPFDFSGTLTAREVSLQIEATVGRLQETASIPVKFSAAAEQPSLSLGFSGNLSTGTGQLRGHAEVSSGNVNAVLGAFDPELSRSIQNIDALLKPLGVKAEVFASPGGVEINDVELSFGSATANGAANILFGDTTRFDVALSVSRLQLDDWIPRQGDDPREGAERPASSDSAEAVDGPSPFQIPTNIAGSIAVGIEALTYSDGVVSQVDISAELVDGAVSISHVSALLPGGSSFDVQGSLRAVEGLPQFEGQVRSRSDNFRGLLGWLDIPVDDVPSDRLRKLVFRSTVRATPKLVQIYGVDLQMDSTRLSGGLAYAFRERPAFSVDFVVDQLNLDAYLPRAANKRGRAAPDREAPQSGTKTAPVSLIPPGTAALLEGIDTNTKVSVGSLTIEEVPIQGLVIDIGLLGGELTLRRASIESLAGGSFSLSGDARGFSGRPSMNANLDMAASDVAGLARLAGVELPIPSDRLGLVEVSGQVTGSADDLGIDLNIAAVGGALDLKGTIDALAAEPRLDLALNLRNPNVANVIRLFDPQFGTDGSLKARAIEAKGIVSGSPENLSIDLSTQVGDAEIQVAGNVIATDAVSYNLAVSAGHPDAARFVNDLGVAYEPATVNLGNMRLSADVSGTDAGAEIANLKGNFGPASLAGAMSLRLDGPRPNLTGNLTTSEIIVDLFLPRQSDASQSGKGNRGAAQRATSARWSSDPIDISFLRAADANLRIAARGIVYGPYAFVDPQLSLSIVDGALNIDPLTGKLFDGTVELRGRLDDREVPSLTLAIALSDADLQRAVTEIMGVDAVAGQMNIEGNVSAQGRSQRELVQNLQGKASFAAQQGAINGIDLKSLSDRLKRLNEVPDYLALLQTTLNRGQTRFDGLGGTIDIVNGVMRSTDLGGDLEGARLTGQASIDLPRWFIDLQSEVRLSEHPQVPPLGLQVHGPLDAPQRDVKTQEIERYLAQRVGGQLLKKVLPKEAQGIGNLLLGGGTTRQSEESTSSDTDQNQQQQQESEKITPESLLKGLFKGLGR